jgi:NitT/TauT family transport system permease protein
MDLLAGFVFSFLRMSAAYVLSFGFAVSYGAKAAQNPGSQRWMIPLLDLLQSIPILGFFPAAIFVLMRITGDGRLSTELAAVFLIFTSMAWNMAFSVFQSIRGIPRPLLEMSAAFNVKEPLRFIHLIYPACIPGLIFNSMLSCAGGWYFLIASEIIAVGPVKVELPGLGSYLLRAVERGDYGSALTGIAVLSSFTLVMDALVWKPLRTWSRRFRVEEYGTEEAQEGEQLVAYYRRARWFQFVRRALARSASALVLMSLRWNQAFASWSRTASRSRVGRVAGAILVVYAAIRVAQAGTGEGLLIPPEWHRLPGFLFFSLVRVIVAYGLTLLWTVPFALWASRSPRRFSVASAVSQVGASIPATALFPFLVVLLVSLPYGLEWASVVLVMTGMQWYLLFNLLAGTQAVPRDLREMGRVFSLPERLYLRAIVFPAAVPYFITGSITGWGGAWNALIVSEYLVFKGEEFVVPGIGSYLSRSAFEYGSLVGIFAGLILMSGVVLLINRLVWKPLQQEAEERYRVEF